MDTEDLVYLLPFDLRDLLHLESESKIDTSPGKLIKLRF